MVGTYTISPTSGAGTSFPIARSRPLTVAEVDDNTIRILIDGTANWAQNLGAGDSALVTVSDTRENLWLSLGTTLEISTDEQEIDRLWNVAAEAYFEQGRDSRGIAILHLLVHEGAYWSSPAGRIGSLISMVKAKLGSPEDSGDHGTISLENSSAKINSGTDRIVSHRSMGDFPFLAFQDGKQGYTKVQLEGARWLGGLRVRRNSHLV